MDNSNTAKLTSEDVNMIEKKVQKIREDVLKNILFAESGHPGGSLSCIHILTVLYYKILQIYPENFNKKERNHFILSKGHAAPTLYSILYELGFINESTINLRDVNSGFQGHPDKKTTFGVECSTGSLGQGLSVALGIGVFLSNMQSQYKSYVLVGDGELQEGVCWETIMLAGHIGLNNLVLIVDRNGLQLDGQTEEIVTLEPLSDKFIAFNWNVIEVDGHNVEDLYNAFTLCNQSKLPVCIIANTIKGYGIKEFENCCNWHSLRNLEEYKKIIKDII